MYAAAAANTFIVQHQAKWMEDGVKAAGTFQSFVHRIYKVLA
jgi:hypothetical protein